jgi:hypothetical protein
MPVLLTVRPAADEMMTMRPAPLHRGDGRARAQEGGRQVRGEHRLPVLRWHVLKRAADLADYPAGGVDQDVNRADGGEEVRDGDRVGEVRGRQR